MCSIIPHIRGLALGDMAHKRVECYHLSPQKNKIIGGLKMTMDLGIFITSSILEVKT